MANKLRHMRGFKDGWLVRVVNLTTPMTAKDASTFIDAINEDPRYVEDGITFELCSGHVDGAEIDGLPVEASDVCLWHLMQMRGGEVMNGIDLAVPMTVDEAQEYVAWFNSPEHEHNQREGITCSIHAGHGPGNLKSTMPWVGISPER